MSEHIVVLLTVVIRSNKEEELDRLDNALLPSPVSLDMGHGVQGWFLGDYLCNPRLSLLSLSSVPVRKTVQQQHSSSSSDSSLAEASVWSAALRAPAAAQRCSCCGHSHLGSGCR